MVKLGAAAKYLRGRLGLSQRAAAKVLGISHIHLNNIENEKVSPTAAMIEKYYEAWDIDLYMLAVVKFSDDDRLPEEMRSTFGDMIEVWESDIERRLTSAHKEDGASCLEFKD